MAGVDGICSWGVAVSMTSGEDPDATNYAATGDATGLTGAADGTS